MTTAYCCNNCGRTLEIVESGGEYLEVDGGACSDCKTSADEFDWGFAIYEEGCRV
jgi:hypothetical protein